MRTASVAEFEARLSAYLEEREAGPIVVTRNGKPVAVLLFLEDEEEIERLTLAYSPRLRAILEKSEQQIEEGHGIEHDEFWRQVEADTRDDHP